MAWKIKHTDDVWDGPTHELAGRYYTGATRTSESRPLVWFEQKQPTTPSSKQKPAPKKAAPKPKGATAWD
jgi:hypothetical protein